MLKKAGLLTVGITAGLLAVAPIASAGESEHGDNDRKSSQDDDHGKKDHGKKDHGKKHHSKKDDGDQKGTGNVKCSAEGGDLDNDATAGDSLASVGQVAGPVASGNTGQLLSCNSFLNDILNDNEVNVASPLL